MMARDSVTISEGLHPLDELLILHARHVHFENMLKMGEKFGSLTMQHHSDRAARIEELKTALRGCGA